MTLCNQYRDVQDIILDVHVGEGIILGSCRLALAVICSRIRNSNLFRTSEVVTRRTLQVRVVTHVVTHLPLTMREAHKPHPPLINTEYISHDIRWLKVNSI